MAAERRLAPVGDDAAEIMERVIAAGDLARLSPGDRVAYYAATCRSLGLNPLTKPFDYITLSGRMVLYATKGAADQLRAQRGISVRVVGQSTEADVLVVTVEGSDEAGRIDSEIGAVSVAGLRGEALANARMKALTKAKRRLTLSMCGLGMSDESEIDTLPGAERVPVDPVTGEIVPARPAARPARQIAPPRPAPEPGIDGDDARGGVVEVAARPAARVNLGPLHADIQRVAANGGSGMGSAAAHALAHDWAAVQFGADSLAALSVDQVGQMRQILRGKDAGWLDATAARLRERIAAHHAEEDGPTLVDVETGETLPGMPGAEADGEAGADRWTE